MEASYPLALVLAAGALALLSVRALAAALEAALVAVGLPRAQALGQEAGAPPSARALARLFDDPESTSFGLRASVTLATVFAGFLAGAAGALANPGAAEGIRFAWGAVAALAAALVSMPMAAAGRALGAASPEPVALAFARPFAAARTLLRPLAAVVRVASGGGRFSLPRPPLEEMERALAEWAKTQGASGQATTELIHNVFEFREKIARDVMVPRTDVVAVEIDTRPDEILRLLSEEGHSRMPVYRESLDQVLGVLHARDLVPMLQHPELIVLRDLLRPPYFVPWSKPVDALLREMQRRKLHMAFVVDEHGGIMGICTLEDVLEQIVGALGDEFTEEDARPVEAHADGTFSVQGQASIREFNEAAKADLPEDEGIETVGGFVNQVAGVIPVKGERIHWHGWAFTVVDADPRKVTRLRAARVKRS
ncbi:MAG: hemolysin family protein [Anaeromyxobacteraceae bacterium]